MKRKAARAIKKTGPAPAAKWPWMTAVVYCLSYRPSARRGNDPYNPMSHIGFRLVMSEKDWQRSHRK
jgi:formylglycine-generating enzyme required for sulfatase activity